MSLDTDLANLIKAGFTLGVTGDKHYVDRVKQEVAQ